MKKREITLEVLARVWAEVYKYQTFRRALLDSEQLKSVSKKLGIWDEQYLDELFKD